jgi:[protein-PII] uridylyltransferase
VQQLRQTITNPERVTKSSKRLLSRRLRELPWPTQVNIKPGPNKHESTIMILACDRPGLLATIAELLIKLDLSLLSARIATLGERVEDTFVVETEAGTSIDSGEATYTIAQTIRQGINRALAVA